MRARIGWVDGYWLVCVWEGSFLIGWHIHLQIISRKSTYMSQFGSFSFNITMFDPLGGEGGVQNKKVVIQGSPGHYNLLLEIFLSGGNFLFFFLEIKHCLNLIKND